MSPDQLAPWGRRVGAYLVDFWPNIVLSVGLWVIYGFLMSDLLRSGTTGTFSSPPGWIFTASIALMIVSLAALGWQIYNRWIVGGRTGQSWGKRVMKIRLLSETTGQPIGPLYAFVRDLVHILDGMAYIGYLWPLWDQQRQTFSDKLLRTLVVVETTPAPGPDPTPGRA